MSDENARNLAIDVTQSFIVQAPAGSGKTELLTQRYLNLLAHTVTNPEEIIAITFTRKAASEMRERIIKSLEMADNTPEPMEAHKKKTWLLASKVLNTNKKLKWNLLENPNRLRIITIDALSAWLNAQIPLLSGFGAKAQILEEVNPVYEKATQTLIENPSPLQASITKLLLHLDNNAELLSRLLITLLQKREQWLPHIIQVYQHQEQLKPMMEQGLVNIVTDILEKVDSSIPDGDKAQIINLCATAASELSANTKAHALQAGLNQTQFPLPQAEHLEIWQAIATMFLTKDNTFRSKVDKRLGFPPTKKAEKQQILFLLEKYKESDELLQAFVSLAECPPIHYTNKQWEIISSLLEVLPMLCAHLNLEFRAHEGTDFVELTLGALRALGEEDSPTDLALYLDYQIKHLLIDEFQDTSVMQFTLIEKLIQTWDASDSKSLFVVGDPMQSIYRFRNAEVGLFLRAQSQGIGQLKLTPLKLSRNFRSNPTLVNWVNNTFSEVFPKTANIHSGAVSYSPSIAAATPTADEKICYYAVTNSEVRPLIELIQTLEMNNPHDSIAVLVKSRTHLQNLIPALKQAELTFQAVELETLSQRQEIIDLLTLTKALTNLGDRIAWLALLRSPFCGLTLNDLHTLSEQAGEKPLWSLLLDYHNIQSLTNDAKCRLDYVIPIIANAFNQQGILTLSQWVKGAWQALKGPQTLADKNAEASAKRFFELLCELQHDFSIDQLEERLVKLYAKPDNCANAALQIMTIHKSKGLEFDHVIIPELQRAPPPQKDELFMWLESPNQYGQEDLIFAPISASYENQDSIHHYLKNLEKSKLQHESVRVLYVALTRAKKSLHLHCSLNIDEQGEVLPPSKNSFAALLWQTHQDKFMQTLEVSEADEADTVSIDASLYRQTTASINSLEKSILPANQPIDTLNHAYYINPSAEQAARIGTVIHEALQKISLDGIEKWDNKANYWGKRLRQLGCHNETANKLVISAINNILNDPKGKWILNAHTGAASEYAITAVINNKAHRLIIDRTFIDESNTRWIIDFKTATPEEGESLTTFLEKQKGLYQKQLNLYAQAFSLMETQPIKLGLYFPLCSAWIEWETVGSFAVVD